MDWQTIRYSPFYIVHHLSLYISIYTTLVYLFRIQEIMDDNQREAGRIPRTVECELTADLGIHMGYVTNNNER